MVDTMEWTEWERTDTQTTRWSPPGPRAQHPLEYVVLNAASISLVLLFALVVRDVREAVGAGGKERHHGDEHAPPAAHR